MIYAFVMVFLGVKFGISADIEADLVASISIKDVLLINMVVVLLYLFLALIGLPAILILSKFLYDIGSVTANIIEKFGLPAQQFVLNSTLHGLGEIFIVVLILQLSFRTTFYWIKFIFDLTDTEPAVFYRQTLSNCKKILLAAVPILIISGIVECYFSRPNFMSMLTTR